MWANPRDPQGARALRRYAALGLSDQPAPFPRRSPRQVLSRAKMPPSVPVQCRCCQPRGVQTPMRMFLRPHLMTDRHLTSMFGNIPKRYATSPLDARARAVADRLLADDPDLSKPSHAAMRLALNAGYARALELFRVG